MGHNNATVYNVIDPALKPDTYCSTDKVLSSSMVGNKPLMKYSRVFWIGGLSPTHAGLRIGSYLSKG